MNSPETPGPRWRKSSRSSGQGGDCVEVATLSPGVAIRDSKDPHGPMLTVGHTTFAALLRSIHAGSLDLTSSGSKIRP